MIKNAIGKCIPCQAVGTNAKEPISNTEMHKRPWDTFRAAQGRGGAKGAICPGPQAKGAPKKKGEKLML